MNTHSHADRTWFTADLHAHHAKIISYSHRPFANVSEMNEALVENWNSRVRAGDVVYVIGDFVLGNGPRGDKAITEFRNRLNGRIRMILGNHDEAARRNPGLFEWTARQVTVTVQGLGGGQKVALNHYAQLTWDCAHRGAYALYGHSHGKLQEGIFSASMDVGVDLWDFTPVPYATVREYLSARVARRERFKARRA